MVTMQTPTITTTTQTPTDTAPFHSLVGGYHWTHPPPPYPYYPPYASTDFSFSYSQQVSHYYPPFPLYHQPHSITSVIVQYTLIIPASSDITDMHCISNENHDINFITQYVRLRLMQFTG